jgi:hypothetical protein
MLEAYCADDDDFASWVCQYPLLAGRVEWLLQTLDQKRNSVYLPDLLAARDAALSLHNVALEGGYEDMAEIFKGKGCADGQGNNVCAAGARVVCDSGLWLVSRRASA